MKLFTTLAFSILIVNSAFSFENNKTIPDKYHGLFYSSVSKSKDILLQKKLIVEGGTIWQIYYTIQKSDTLYAFGKNSEKIQTINDNYQYEWSINDEQKRFKIFLNDDKIIVNDKVLSKKETLLKFNPELPSNELNTQSFRVTVIKHPSLPFNTINASYSPMYQNDYKVNRTSDSLFTFGGIIYSDQELNISPLAKESFGNNTREDTLYYPRFKLYVSPGKHSQLYIDSNLNIHFLGHLADFNTQYNQLPKDTDYFYKLEEYLNKKDLIECIEDKLSELQKVYDTHLTNQQYSNEFKRYIFTDILIAKANKISVLHNQNYNLQYFLNKKESKTHIPEYQLEDLLNEVIPDHKAIDIEIYMKKIDKYPFVNYLRYHNPGISFNSETFFLNFINENKEILSDEENEIFDCFNTNSSVVSFQ